MVPRRRYLRAVAAGVATATTVPVVGCLDATGRNSSTESPNDTPVRNRSLNGDGTVRQFQADACNVGTVASAGPIDGVETAWRTTPAKYEASQPAVTAEAVYVQFDGTLVALERATGETRWKTRVGHAGSSTPAVHDGTAYVTVWNGGPDVPRGLAAVDVDSGDVRWRVGTDLEVTASPTVTDDGVYVGGGYETSTVLAADHDGTERWRRSVGEYASTPAVRDGTVYVGAGETHALVALDAETGEERWRAGTDGRANDAPTVVGPSVLLGDEAGTVTAFDAASGEETWTASTDSGVVGSLAVTDDAVLIPTADALVALAADGTERWHAPIDLAPTAPFVAGDACYLATGRTVRAFALDGGEERWSVRTRERQYTDVVLQGITAPVAVAARTVFVATRAGDVYAFGGT